MFEREKSRLQSRKETVESRELAWKKVCAQVKSELGVDISRMYDTDWDKRDIFSKLREVLASPEYNMFEAIETMYQKMQELKIKLGNIPNKEQ